MHIYKKKFDVFLEVAGLLNRVFDLAPLLHGSLGLHRAIGGQEEIDDVDILIPKEYTFARWDELCVHMKTIGFEPIPGECEFERDGQIINFGSQDRLEMEFGVNTREFLSYNEEGVRFRQMLPEHFLQIYRGVINIPWWRLKAGKGGYEKLDRIRRRLNNGDVIPAYGEKSLAELVPTILSLFGVDMGRPLLPEKLLAPFRNDFRKIVLLFVDGLGYDQFIHSQFMPLFKSFCTKGIVEPITTVFPSTTPAAITTAHTGLVPAEHGLPEWYVYFSELDRVIETLAFRPSGSKNRDSLRKKGVDPGILYDGPTAYTRLAEAGIPSYLLLPEDLVGSAYSMQAQRGAITIPYRRASDMFVALRRKLREVKGPAYFFAYWSQVDSSGHEFGPHSSEQRAEISLLSHVGVSEILNSIDRATAAETLFLLCADHGQVGVREDNVVFLEDKVDLSKFMKPYKTRNGFIPPTGSPRNVFLHIRENKTEEALAALSEGLEGVAEVMRTRDAVDKNLFGNGEPSERFLSRIGDILILPTGHISLWNKGFKKDPGKFLGIHGGLSQEEMMIPFGIARLYDLCT